MYQYVLALVLILAVTRIDAQANLEGFVTDVDTTSYRRLTYDARDIINALAAGNYAGANSIYTTGKNSVRSNGARRILKAIASTVRAGEKYYDVNKGFHGVNYIEKFCGPITTTNWAAGNRDFAPACLQWILLAYAMHEFDVADANLKVAAGNANLAIEEISDAVGIWYGYTTVATGGLQVSVAGLWRNARTWRPCAGTNVGVVTTTVAAFKGMQAAAKAIRNGGSRATNYAAYQANYNKFIKKEVPAVGLRTIMYQCGIQKRSQQAQRMCFIWTKILQPYVAAGGRTAAAQLASILTSKTVLANPATVRAYVTTIAANFGLSAVQAGVCALTG